MIDAAQSRLAAVAKGNVQCIWRITRYWQSAVVT